MHPPRDRSAYIDRSLLLFLLALLLFVSPLKAWWATPSVPWYTVYLVWGGIIIVAYWLQCRHHDEL